MSTITQIDLHPPKTKSKIPKIALVIPAYNEVDSLGIFCEHVGKVIEAMDDCVWEIIFVDDGSSDNTWGTIENFARADSRIKGVSLSRNFGKEIALTAGVESVSDADAVIFMDADLQHPPSLIPEMIRQWKLGFKIVATQRSSIRYSWTREMGSRLFYFLLSRYSDLEIIPKASDFRLIDRTVLEVLRTFRERNRFFRGIVDWMGFSKTFITFEAPNRVGGESTFNFRSLFGLAINSFTSFSLLPLRMAGYLGLFIFSSSFLILSYMIATEFIIKISTYTTIGYFVVFNTLLFGVILAALGLIALYIGNIHTEVVGRPIYIVQEKVGF